MSYNKVFAKLGSDYKKPDATTLISRDNYKDIVFPLPVRDLLFIGKKTESQLATMGIRTIGELAETNAAVLRMRFGKAGEMMYKYANGLDDSPVVSSENREDAKSVGSGFTFKHDLVSREECRVGIEYLADDIGRRLRKLGMKCATVQLTVKDEYLRSVQRQRPQNPPTDIAREIADTAYNILMREWNENKPIRMITVTASSLINTNMVAEQINLFDYDIIERRKKSKRKEETVDKIRQKHGNAAIMNGAILDSDIGIYEPKNKR